MSEPPKLSSSVGEALSQTVAMQLLPMQLVHMMRGSLQEHAEHAVLCLAQLLELEGGQRGGGLGELALLLGGDLRSAGWTRERLASFH